MANERGIGKYDVISSGALETWEDFINLAKQAHEELLTLVKDGPKVNESLNKVEAVDNLAAAVKKVSDNINTLLKVQKQLDTINNKLNDGDEKAAIAAQKAAEAKKRATAAAKKRAQTTKINSDLKKLEIQLENQSITAKERLRIKNKMLTLEMKKLGNITKKNVGEYRRLTREYQKNEAEINKLNRRTSESVKVGKKHSNALGGIMRQVKSLIVSYVGIRAAWNSVVKVFEDTKTLDSLNFAIENVIKSETEQAETLDYVRGITNAYGTDLIDTTRSYLKFRAAIGATNLSVQEGRQIFDSFAKSAAVLGLRADEVNGVFLALEQMISKGKVTTEELRRQLGERIPGAFNIMANALGVTTRELDEMLKKGEVLSEEALPKMAIELEKTFGIEQVQQVNTLVAAQERLRTTWLSFIQELQASDLFLDKLNAINEAFRLMLQRMGFLITDSGKGATLASENINAIAGSSETAAENLFRLQSAYDEASTSYDDLQASIGRIWSQYDSSLSNEEIMNLLTPDEKAIFKSWEGLRAQRDAYGKAIKDLWQREHVEQLNLSEKTDEELISMRELYYNQAKHLVEDYSKFQVNQLNKDKYLRKDALTEIEGNIPGAMPGVDPNSQLKPFLNYYAAIDEIRRRDSQDELKVTDDTWNERLAIFKAQQKAALEAYKEHLEAMRMAADKEARDRGLNELEVEDLNNGLKMDMATDLFNFQVKQNNDLLNFVKGHEKETVKTIADGAKLAADYQKEKTDFQISEEDRYHKLYMDNEEERQRKMQDNIDEQILAIERMMNARINALAETQTAEKNGLKFPWQFDDSDSQFAKDSLKVLIDGYEQILQIEGLTTDQRGSFEMKLHNLKMQLMEEEQATIEENAQRRLEREKATVDLIADYERSLYDALAGFQDARMEQLDWDHERNLNLAGENTDQRLAEENRYDKEKRKMQRRAAVLDKANSIFNILLNTYKGIMAAMSNPVTMPLIPFIKLQGAISLAAAAATPIPKYEHGGEHSGGLAVFSEKGSELFIPDNGTPILTPDSETMANMPSGTFIPHKETQEILAKSAMNNFINEASDINLEPTNRLLRKMANKSEVIYQDRYKITNKNNIFGKYVTRN